MFNLPADVYSPLRPYQIAQIAISLLPNVPLYPVAPQLSLASSPKLAGAIQKSISGITTNGRAPPAFSLTLVDASSGGAALPVGGYKQDDEHYIASMGKVGVMYSAFALRDMVRRWAAKNMPASPEALLAGLETKMDDWIERSSSIVLGGPAQRRHRVPHYRNVFSFTAVGNTIDVQFSPLYLKALEEMIIASDDEKAGECIHGIGYSYLNGALEASGLFDSSTKKGFWVAGDYSFGKNWPSVRIPSQNDGPVAEASTSQIAAQLVAIIMRRVGLDTSSCDSMIDLLSRAAAGNQAPSFLWRSELASNSFARNSVTHSKIGIGPLKSGPTIFSEASVIRGVGASAKTYIVVFQNFTPGTYKWSDLFTAIRNSIATYEAP
jgi:hypothetical protein